MIIFSNQMFNLSEYRYGIFSINNFVEYVKFPASQKN